MLVNKVDPVREVRELHCEVLERLQTSHAEHCGAIDQDVLGDDRVQRPNSTRWKAS